MPNAIISPCVRVCAVDGRSGNCIGCGRTLPEIAQWSRYSNAERQRIMDLLPARLQALKATGKP
jgi:predicted Fe-S protein YdhL (DUF1289 family)